MTEERALTLAQPRDATASRWTSIKDVAAEIAAMYSLRPAEAAMAMLRGWELGIPISTAIECVYVITTSKGRRTALSAQLVNGLIQRSGLLKKMEYKRLENDKHQCVGYEIYMERINGVSWRGSFTQQDAEQAGLLTKDNWKNYDDDMYFSRTLTKVGRRVLPDVILGMYTPEELGVVVNEEAHTVESATVEGSYTIVEPEGDSNQKEPEGKSTSLQPQTLADLLVSYLPDAVMAASTALGLPNPIPATPEEVAKVFAELMKDQKEAKSD